MAMTKFDVILNDIYSRPLKSVLAKFHIYELGQKEIIKLLNSRSLVSKENFREPP